MQGQVTVLLVSVGQEPAGLNKELTRLGVNVLPGALHDCEELIDEHQPDLVVLVGARGAMELASLIEGHDGDDPPRMVIAADRKELAKMVGLNRDVVVSLFATESGDRVLGQRIESLARRAARRRTASIPPPAVKPTSLGLPSTSRRVQDTPAGVLGRLELKKTPGLSKPAAFSRKATPAGHQAVNTPISKRVAQPTELEKSTPAAKVTIEPVVKGSDAPGAPAFERASQANKKSIHRGTPNNAVQPSEDEPSTKAWSSAKQPASVGQVPSSVAESVLMEVSDSEFMSIRPSDFPEEDLELESIPPLEDPPVEVAGEGAAKAPPPASSKTLKDRNSDFDVSEAEAALDHLEDILINANKAKTPPTGTVEAHARGADGPFAVGTLDGPPSSVAGSLDFEAGSNDEVVSNDEAGSNDEVVSNDEAGSNDEVSSSKEEAPLTPAQLSSSKNAFAATMPLGMSPFGTGGGEDDPGSVGREPVSASELSEESQGTAAADALPPSLPGGKDAEQEVDEEYEEQLRRLSRPPKKGSGAGKAALALGLVAAAAAAGIYMGQTQGGAVAEPRGNATVVSQEAASVDETAREDPKKAQNSDAPKEIDLKPKAEPEAASKDGKDDASTAREGSAATADAVAATSETETARGPGGRMEVAQQPFVREDTHKPSCEMVLGGQLPPTGPDIEHDAAVIWGAARKLIVQGKVEEAHKRMCEAAAINPSSAAVEGLAGLYLDMFSLDQAEAWAKKAEELRPGQRDVALLMGDIYGMRGQLDKARSTWLSALKMTDATKVQIRALSRDYSTAANKQLVAGAYVKAEIWYRRAAIIDDQNFAALMGLANTFMRTKRPAYALAYAYRVLDMSELVPEMQVLVGEVAAQAGNKEEARLRFEKALSIRSDFYPAKRGLSLLQ